MVKIRFQVSTDVKLTEARTVVAHLDLPRTTMFQFHPRQSATANDLTQTICGPRHNVSDD